MEKRLLWFLFLFCSFVYSQEERVLTYQNYIESVVLEHPIAKRAELQDQFAEAETLRARGGFEPLIESNWSEKDFENKDYYRIFRTEVSLPTYYGLSLNAGFQNHNGVFLNPQNNTTGQGLWNLGLEANLLQGLLIDERRADLRKAEIFQDLAENEQNRVVNELLFDSSKAYLYWQQINENQKVIEENLEVARQYFQFTKETYLGGAYPAIDTLEAFLYVQDREAMLQKNEVELIKARQNLENYLWYDSLPLALQTDVRPQQLKENDFEIYLTSLDLNGMVQSNPDILKQEYKIQMLEVERDLKRDKLKPKLKVKYNPLFNTTDESIAPNAAIANYEWGFGFEFPIFRRRARADLQSADLKIEEQQFDLQYKRQSLQNKLEANLERQATLQEQVTLQEDLVENYRRMLQGEQTRFEYGESSVFLLNSRQEKYLDSQLKRIEAETKYNKELLDYFYLSNQFVDIAQ